MSWLLNVTSNILKRNVPSIRSISTSSSKWIKEIQEKQVEQTLVVEGVELESSRASKLLKESANPKFCPECTLGLNIKHTDVLILSQYVRSDGCMLPRRVTGLCKRQQKRIGTLVTMAQKAGLMPNLAPEWSKKDPKKRYGWKKYNKYYLESTIKY